MKKNKGFTLVELLAMLVVLGMLMAIAVPNVMGILNNQKINGIKQDVIKMADTAKIKVVKDDKIPKPAEGQAIVFSLNSVDVNKDITKGPNGGFYNRYESFVVYTKEDNQYKYYVRLVEEIDDGTSYGIDMIDSNKVEDDKIGSVVKLGLVGKDEDKQKLKNKIGKDINEYYLGNQKTFDDIKNKK